MIVEKEELEGAERLFFGWATGMGNRLHESGQVRDFLTVLLAAGIVLSPGCTIRRDRSANESAYFALEEAFSGEGEADSGLLETDFKKGFFQELHPPVLVKKSFAVIGDEFAAGFLSDSAIGSEVAVAFDDYYSIAHYLSALEKGHNPFSPEKDPYSESPFVASGSGAYLSSGAGSLVRRMSFSREHSQNLGVVGASLAAYEKSLRLQVERLRKGHQSVIIQVGVHDFCSAPFREEVFRNNFIRLIEAVAAKLAASGKLIIMPVLPVFRLSDLSDRKVLNLNAMSSLDKYIVEIGFKGKRQNISCQQVHRAVCTPLTERTREENWQRWKQLNQIIGEITGGVLDLSGGVELIYLSEIFNRLRIDSSQVAKDCFHPSGRFNEQLSRKIADKIL